MSSKSDFAARARGNWRRSNNQQSQMTSYILPHTCKQGLLGVALCSMLAVPATGLAQAVAPSPAAPTTGGAGIRLDPFVIYPSVSLAEGYNDNVGLSSANRVSSAVTILSPAVLAELKGASTAYRIGYTGTYGWYSNSSADNYDYHEFRAGADFDFSSRSRLLLRGEYLMKSDPRGSTLASTGVTTPNKYDQAGFGGVYSYGAIGAQGRIEVEAFFTDKRYTNNRAVTDTLDFESQRYGGTFFWRIGPKTEWLFKAQQTRTDYTSAASVQDNTERRFLTGLKWEATALTTGTFSIGQSDRKYSSANVPNAKGFVWEGSIRWSPLTYSIVDFTTGKGFNDSQGGLGSSYVTNQYYTLAWNHAWTERIRSELRGSYSTDNYSGLGREDKISGVGAKLTYDMRRWLILGAEYTYTERSSNQAGADYKRNLILFSLKATL